MLAQEKEVRRAEAATTQPNMIFILTDELNFISAQKMPGISSQLTEECACFEKAFVSPPVHYRSNSLASF
jgi:hypothetical protein